MASSEGRGGAGEPAQGRAGDSDPVHASEIRFRRLFESGIIGIMITDTAGAIYEANDAFLAIVGYSREDLEQGRLRWRDITPPEWMNRDELAVRQLEQSGVATPWEKEYVRKDGTRVPVLVGVATLDPPRSIAFISDLSAEKRAEAASVHAARLAQRETADRKRAEQALRDTEEQLRQSQKMEAIGALAGSIAHDFNNLLSVILGYTETLLGEVRSGDPMREDLTQIARAGERAAELTRRLLAFSRRQVLNPRVVELGDSVSSMARMLERIIGEDVELVLPEPRAVGRVFVDPSQLEQVLLNLAVNAREAMPRGGKLSVDLADVELGNADGDELGLSSGRYVKLVVSDTGSGIEPRIRARIFEPFFTTKDRGTGLGLSTVFGIVKQSGGSIGVTSELGRGTSFAIYLPWADPARHPASDHPPPAQRKLHGNECVLLVEDDEQVRALACAILRRHGYRVLDASSGGEALLICEQVKEPIDLLLTDVVMPRMSGRELAERVSARRPDIKVLFMSGYTDDAVMRHGVLGAEMALVSKPLMPQPLLSKLREVLDAKG
jgi:PAS domain S-box-containing protein